MITTGFPGEMSFDVLVVGGGPCGLGAAWEAAALALKGAMFERGLVASAQRRYPEHMIFASTADTMEIGGMRPEANAENRVTRGPVVAHFERIAELLPWPVYQSVCVTSIDAEKGAFRVHADGRVLVARAVILATGQYDAPLYLGVPGEDLPHVQHLFDSSDHYSGQRVMVVGGSYSALETTLALTRAGVDVVLVHRGAALGAANRLDLHQGLAQAVDEQRLSIHLASRVVCFTSDATVVEQTIGEQLVRRHLPCNAVLVQAGFRADSGLFVGLGIHRLPDGLVDHDRENGVTRIPGAYVVGSAGNGEFRGGNRFGITSGLPQARKAVAHLTAWLQTHSKWEAR